MIYYEKIGSTSPMPNIERINFLAKKQREEGLTEEEKAEQTALRKEYVASVVGNLRSQLDNTYVVDENGKHKLEQKPEETLN